MTNIEVIKSDDRYQVWAGPTGNTRLIGSVRKVSGTWVARSLKEARPITSFARTRREAVEALMTYEGIA